MKNLKYIMFTAIFFVIFKSAFSQEEVLKKIDIDDNIKNELMKIFDSEMADGLIRTGNIFSVQYKNTALKPKILPSIPFMQKIFNESSVKVKDSVFLLENLYLHKLEEMSEKNNSAAKILCSISKLKGIEYYSHTSKKMKTLYAESYIVEPVETDNGVEYKKVKDPDTDKINGLKILARQQDLTFGDYIYKYEYFQDGNDVGMICTNTETLKYSIFKIISPENLCISLTVKQFDNYLLVYCSIRASFLKLPGIDRKLKNSFLSRADALNNWFINEFKK